MKTECKPDHGQFRVVHSEAAAVDTLP